MQDITKYPNKVLLIQPLGTLYKTNGFVRTANLEPLALEYIQSALEQVGVSSTIYYGLIDEETLLNEVLEESLIAVCFSVYTYQYSYCLQLASKIKSLFKNLGKKPPVIIFGGYHPSAAPKEVVENKEVDIVVKGEGEFTLQELIGALISNSCLSDIRGIWYKDSLGKIIENKPRDICQNPDMLPLPKRKREVLSNARQHQIAYPAPSQQKNIAQVLYSRGCPYACVFCSSVSVWNKKVAWRSPEKVVDEIEYLHNEFGTNLVYFPDLTFNLNRKKVFEFCNEFIKRNLPIHWWGLFRLDRLDNEMLYMLKEANCVKLSIGLESEADFSSKIKDNYSLNKLDYKEILNTANDIGLIIKALLIIGFPEDTKEKIKNYNNFLKTLPIDEIRISFITPFPGTKIWNEYTRLYLPEKFNMDNFTTEEPVINHPSINKDELVSLQSNIVNDFYTDPKYIEHVKNKIKAHSYLRNSFLEYFEFLINKGILNANYIASNFN